jgi:hypothetical protein
MADHRPHALHRFFGAGGTLLYIGMTADLPTEIRDQLKATRSYYSLQPGEES